MKKIILAVTLIASSFISAQAQDETPATRGPIMSKRGYPILPEAGDWSISFNANPLLRYVGNVFNQSTNLPQNLGFVNGQQTIMGRYFVDANTAYRAFVRLGKSSTTTKNLVLSNEASLTNPIYVEDKQTVSNSAFYLGAGLEKRRGVGRVQGIYGAQALIGLGGSKVTTDYGNAFTDTHPTPVSTSNFTTKQSGTTDSREIENKQGSTFTFMVQGFLGVEYFIAPKISLGAEYAWGPTLTATGKGESQVQTYDNNSTKTTTTQTGGSSSFGFDNGITTINLNFFF